MIKTVGVIGAGTMGNPDCSCSRGFLKLVDVAQPMLDRANHH